MSKAVEKLFEEVLTHARESTDGEWSQCPANLRKYGDLYMITHGLKPGMLVTWKKGLRNRNWPFDGQPAYLVDILVDNVSPETDSGDPRYMEPLTARILLKTPCDDFEIYTVDLQRLQPYIN